MKNLSEFSPNKGAKGNRSSTDLAQFQRLIVYSLVKATCCVTVNCLNEKHAASYSELSAVFKICTQCINALFAQNSSFRDNYRIEIRKVVIADYGKIKL